MNFTLLSGNGTVSANDWNQRASIFVDSLHALVMKSIGNTLNNIDILIITGTKTDNPGRLWICIFCWVIEYIVYRLKFNLYFKHHRAIYFPFGGNHPILSFNL